jgi:ArsR family transcriptional regulator
MNSSDCQLAQFDPRNMDFFKALADGSRLDILLRLAFAGRECTVSQIAQDCPLSLSVVSRHLKMLKEAGILSAEKRGKEVVYRVLYKNVAQQLREFANALEGCCPE